MSALMTFLIAPFAIGLVAGCVRGVLAGSKEAVDASPSIVSGPACLAVVPRACA